LIDIINQREVIVLQSHRILWNNTEWELLRRSGWFMVTNVGTNWKPAHDFLLVINSDISYRIEVIADYFFEI